MLPQITAIESSLLALNRRHHLATVATGAELQIPDALPRPGGQTTIGNRDGDRGAHEGRFDMSLL